MKLRKSICILLLLAIGLSVIFMTLNPTIAGSGTMPILSVVPDGVAGGTSNSTQIPAVVVGSTFTVDVRVDNTGSVKPGISGLTYNLTFDPTVLKLTAFKVKQTSFWGSAASDITDPLVQGNGSFIENAIIINAGNPGEATTNSGVATTLTFQVLSTGKTNIALKPSDVGIAYMDYPDNAGNSYNVAASIVNAVYGPSPSAPPHGPAASFTPTDGSTFVFNTTVQLNASSSQPGFDVQTCNITSYAWRLEYLNGTTLTSLTGVTPTFNASALGAFRVILIVTANDTQASPSPSYTSTNSTSAIIDILSSPKSAMLDVFTDTGGIGPGTSSGLYAPLQLVQIYGNLTNSNGSPVTDQDVDFSILNLKNTIILVRQGVTNGSGIASSTFRLPNPDPTAPQYNMGTWSITAAVNISNVIVSDFTNFTFNYQSGIENVNIPATIHTSQTIPIQLTIDNRYLSSQWTQLSITLFDSAGIPIGSANVAAPQQLQNITIVDSAITIPSWAFTGQATAYLCLLTNSTSASAQNIPLCPETTATFQILP